MSDAKKIIMYQLAEIAGVDAMSLTHEAIGNSEHEAMYAAYAFREYCHHLFDNDIRLPSGKYEPHAMYFRVWMLRRVKELKQAVDNVLIANGVVT